MDPKPTATPPVIDAPADASSGAADDHRGWIEQQQYLLDTEMRALWLSGGFTLLGLFVAAILIYLNRI